MDKETDEAEFTAAVDIDKYQIVCISAPGQVSPALRKKGLLERIRKVINHIKASSE